MKNLTRLMSFVLVALMVLGSVATLVACKKDDDKKPGDDVAEGYKDPFADLAGDYDKLSSAIYDLALGEFKTAYEAAKKETNVSRRFALMAIAEAKLMESAVMLPTSTEGGNYAISRVAPNTVDYSLWGNDYRRYHQALVANTFIKAEDRAEMKAKWGEVKGTGSYMSWAKTFLAQKGYKLKDTYTIGYSSDPETWDVLASSRTADSDAIINTYDGLMEYDVEGVLQPALAEKVKVSDDGLKYTFTIRKGATWVDSQGRKVADVQADDFVAGMQHMMDVAGGLEYLLNGVIVNAGEYINGTVTDFTKVGVKAIDKNTLEYTLVAPTPYFLTMLGYGVFAPMSRSFFVSRGGKFGADFKPDAADYKYGKTQNDIAYCGPYLVTNATAKNTIVFEANPTYWNKDGINVKKLTWLFNDGEDALKSYNDAVSGVLDGAGLNSASLEKAKKDGNFDKYNYISSTNATTFSAFFNLNRKAFANAADANQCVSNKKFGDENAVRALAAMRNVHFRRALSFSIDRAAYNAQSVGETLKLNSIRNSYTPGTFVALEEEVTVKINGTDKVYKAGTNYGQIVQDQIDADGVKIKAYDPKADDGIGSSDGYDGWYNVDNAVAEFKVAVEELRAAGVTVSADKPIYLDLPYFAGSDTFAKKAQAMKQSVEAALGGAIKINLVECAKSKDWYGAGYFTEKGYEANYDIYDVSGWGPDYGDPATYLDTFLGDYAGYMMKCCGIF